MLEAPTVEEGNAVLVALWLVDAKDSAASRTAPCALKSTLIVDLVCVQSSSHDCAALWDCTSIPGIKSDVVMKNGWKVLLLSADITLRCHVAHPS